MKMESRSIWRGCWADHMKVVHYYNEAFMPLRSITEELSAKLAERLSLQSGKAFGRFRNLEWYVNARRETEEWLLESFTAKGGNPQTRYPRYFVLGESAELEKNFGANAGRIVLEWENLDPQDVSITLDDSMKIHVSGSERRVYTKNELNDYAISNYGSLEALVKHKQEAGEFVEVQVWNLQKW